VAFPEDPSGVAVELDLGGGTWEDITSRARLTDRIVITRGQRGEATRVDPSTCSLTLDNRDGRFTWRNPTGAYYGRIGRNTPLRVTVPGSSYLSLDGVLGSYATTPDHPSLDITGDLDVRIEADTDWRDPAERVLIGKWVAAGSWSWVLRLTGGTLMLMWSPTGAESGIVFAQVPLPWLPRRAAVRAALDVDNGAGGWTARFYWAESLDGPWTAIGDPITIAGVTSIYAGADALRIGPGYINASGVPRYPIQGRVYRAEVRAGIGGTVVAAPDLRAVAAGATGWTDSAGRPWTLGGGASISDRHVRFVGEVSTWPVRWGPSGQDAVATVQASGILRRLSQGAKALDSTLRRRIPSFSPVAYWPMEEDREARQAYSPVQGVRPMTTSGLEFAADDSLAGSSPLPTLGPAATFTGVVPPATAGQWRVEMVYRLDAHPTAVTWLLDLHTTGTMTMLRIVLTPTGGIQVIGEDVEGAQTTIINGSAPSFASGAWTRLWIQAQTSGANTALAVAWVPIGGSGLAHNVTYSGVPGRVTRVTKPAENGAGLDGMALGHISVLTALDASAYNAADQAFAGETAGRRILRLCAEEGVPVTIQGDPDATVAMGPQRPATLLDLLQECADADGGLLAEDPERLGLLYRTRETVYNQPAALTLRYGQGREVMPPLEPVDDDLATRNDIVVSRPGGSSARAVLETGPLSTAPPPAGVGRYDESVTVNIADDAQLPDQAGWRLHLGTVDEARYPTVRVDLARAPHLIPDVLALHLRDRLSITGTPPQWAPGPIEQLAQGWTETIGVRDWRMELACAPASPWQVAVTDDAVLGRVDTDGAVVAAAVTASATTLDVHTTSGPLWTTDPAEMPVDLRVGGEVVTVSAIASKVTDSFTRSVSGGWGTATSGQAWSWASGTAAERSVNGAAGVVSLASSQSTVRVQHIDGPLTDCEILTRVSPSHIATGAAIAPAVLLRYVGTSTYYRARIHFDVGGAMGVSVARTVTQVGSTAPLPWTYTAGSWWWLRVRLDGHRVRMRVWPDGTEPGDWQLDQTITADTIASGSVGLTASALGGNTNTGLSISFDSFEVVSPQRMTVIRAVNGVVKGHAAGTDVRLAQPAIISL